MKMFFVEQTTARVEDGYDTIVPSHVHMELRDAVVSFLRNETSKLLVAKITKSDASLDLFAGKEIVIAERVERSDVINTANGLDLGSMLGYVSEGMTLVKQQMYFRDMAIVGRMNYYADTTPMQKASVSVISVGIRSDIQRMFADTVSDANDRQLKEAELMQALEKELTIDK